MLNKGPAGTVIKTGVGLEPRPFREGRIKAIAGSELQRLKEVRQLTGAEMVRQRS